MSRTTSDGREPSVPADVAAGRDNVIVYNDVAGIRLNYGGREGAVPDEAGEEDGAVTGAIVKQASMSALESRNYSRSGRMRTTDKGAVEIDPNLRVSDAYETNRRIAGISAVPAWHEPARQAAVDADVARPAAGGDEILPAAPVGIEEGAAQGVESPVYGLESGATDGGSRAAASQAGSQHRRSSTHGGGSEAKPGGLPSHLRHRSHDGHASPRTGLAKSPLHSMSPTFHSGSPRIVLLKRSSSYHSQDRSGNHIGASSGNSGSGSGAFSTKDTPDADLQSKVWMTRPSVPGHQRSRSCLDTSWKDGPKASQPTATSSPSATVTFIPSFDQRRSMTSAALNRERRSSSLVATHEEASWKDHQPERLERRSHTYCSGGYKTQHPLLNHGGTSSGSGGGGSSRGAKKQQQQRHHHHHQLHHSYNSRPPLHHPSPQSSSHPSEEGGEEQEEGDFSFPSSGLRRTAFNPVPEQGSCKAVDSDGEHGGNVRQLSRRASEAVYLRGIRDVEAGLEAMACSGPLDLDMASSVPPISCDEVNRSGGPQAEGSSGAGGYARMAGGQSSSKGGGEKGGGTGGGGAGGGAMHPPPSRPPRASNPTRSTLRRSTSARPSQSAMR